MLTFKGLALWTICTHTTNSEVVLSLKYINLVDVLDRSFCVARPSQQMPFPLGYPIKQTLKNILFPDDINGCSIYSSILSYYFLKSSFSHSDFIFVLCVAYSVALLLEQLFIALRSLWAKLYRPYLFNTLQNYNEGSK